MTFRLWQLAAGTGAFLCAGFVIAFSLQGAAPALNAGQDAFTKRCSGCHSLDADKEGPRLRGVVGRKAGSSPGFQYSAALGKSGLVWDDALLMKWLENPQNVVKDTDMEFRVTKAEERSALVSWLKSLSPR